jgi:hypothetical protein
MDYLTKENIALVLAGLALLWQGIRAIAAWTENKTDDKIVEAVEKSIAWVQSVSPAVWGIVEAAAASGKIPKAAKLKEYLLRLDEVHRQVYGKTMAAEAKAHAELSAAGQSALDKLYRPQTAPAE